MFSSDSDSNEPFSTAVSLWSESSIQAFLYEDESKNTEINKTDKNKAVEENGKPSIHNGELNRVEKEIENKKVLKSVSDSVPDKGACNGSTRNRIETSSFWKQSSADDQFACQPKTSTSEESNLGECDTKEKDGTHSLEDIVAQEVIVKSKGFKDICGLDNVKQLLKEAIVYPSKYPHLFQNGRTPWSRALLYGPPGVGKTALAHAAAAEACMPLYQVSSADLMSLWIGNTEKLIRRLFTTLGNKRCILLLDEVDAMCRVRTSKDSEHGRRATTELLIQIQKYEGSPMFVLCATNCPWDIDPAFLRRLEMRIYVPMPDEIARENLLLSYLGSHNPTNSPREEWKKLVSATAGLTGSDLRSLVRSALMKPLHEIEHNVYWKRDKGDTYIPCNSNVATLKTSLEHIPNHMVRCRPVELRDLWDSLKHYDRTVPDHLIDSYQTFMSQHKTNS